jgi:hypothetical protein
MLIMAASVLWEYVRVEPTYRFVIEPWSLRGYELSQGLVIAAGAIGIAILTLLISRGVIKETLASSATAIGFVALGGVVLAILADAKEVKMPFPVHVALAAIGGVVTIALLERFIPEEWQKRRRLARFGMWLVGFVVLLFGVVGPLLQNEQPFWVFVALAGVMLGGLVLFRPPAQLAGLRMTINAIVAIWIMSMTMAASLRQALMEQQFEQNGISASILDLQITSGVLIAWFGGLLGFVGAVGLWAKRRDQIIAHERARKQQAAARESQEQLTA